MAGAFEKIFCAIDTLDLDRAQTLGKGLKGHIGGVKLGLEFYSALGPEGVKAMADLGLPIFLDLKLHDIPNTVAGAVKSLAPLNIAMITVHTSGGVQMMRAAKEAALASGLTKTKILGVTVLTSLDDRDLHGMGMASTTTEQVLTLAGLAQAAGLDGIVCSPLEISAIRKNLGNRLNLVVPGIRPKGSATADQKRVLTPLAAVQAGADYLVIGRPITGAEDPAAAARDIAQSLAGE